MLDAATDRFDRRRDDVAAVRDRRGAEYKDELGARIERFAERRGERALLVRHATLRDNFGACRRKTLLRDLEGLVDDLRRKARKQRRYNSDLADAVGRDAQERRVLARGGKRSIALRDGNRKGNDLDGRDHLARDHRLVGRQRRKGDGFIHLIEAIDAGLVDHQDACVLRKQIGATGKGTIDAHALAMHSGGDLGGGRVLRDVAGLDARDDNLRDAGLRERSDLAGTDQSALLEDDAVLADGMDGNPALRLRERHCAEFHCGFSADCRSRAVISPMIATAISGGDTAPISSPIGA